VARGRRATSKHNRIARGANLAARHVHADVAAGAKVDAFLAHQTEAPLHPAFFELELRNAVPEQAANAIGALEDGHPMARAVQLVGRRQTRRPGPDDRDALTGAYLWRMCDDLALLKCSLVVGGFRRLDLQ